MDRANTLYCTVCDQPVKEAEALYPQEVSEQKAHFCSIDCRDRHNRKSAPSKQNLEAQAAEKK